MSRTLLTTLALLATSSLTVAQSTTLPCWFAPPHVAASVIASASGATTYALACTADCSSIQNGQGTMVNGPSTAAFTQVWLEEGATAQKTLIYDCQVTAAAGGANCEIKAGQDGKTGTITRTTSFKGQEDITVTAGWEKLGIVIASTTTSAEVNSTTSTMTTTSAPTPKATHYSSAHNTTISRAQNSSTSVFPSTSSSTTRRSTSLFPTQSAPAPVTSSDVSGASVLSVQGLGVVGLVVGVFALL